MEKNEARRLGGSGEAKHCFEDHIEVDDQNQEDRVKWDNPQRQNTSNTDRFYAD